MGSVVFVYGTKENAGIRLIDEHYETEHGIESPANGTLKRYESKCGWERMNWSILSTILPLAETSPAGNCAPITDGHDWIGYDIPIDPTRLAKVEEKLSEEYFS